MSNIAIEVNDKLETLAKTVTDLQDAHKSSQGKSEAIERLGEVATSNLEKINALEAKSKALEEKNKELERNIESASAAKYRFSAGESDEKSFYDSNEYRELKSSFVEYLRTGDQPSRETQSEIANLIAKKHLPYGDELALQNEMRYLQKSMTAGIQRDGGYWVMPDRISTMVDRVFETSPMRQVANVVRTTSDSVELIVDDQEIASGGWVGECSPRPETNTNQIGLLTINVHENYTKPAVSQKLLDDAGFDLEGYVATKIIDRLTRQANAAFIAGDAVAKPRGILSYPAAADPDVYQRGAIGQLNSGTAGEFVANTIIQLDGLLKQEYQPNAVWMMNRTSFTEVMTLVNGSGDYLLNPMVLAQGADKILLGKPVVFATDMPKKAGDALALALGDFSRGYTIVDRFGIRVLRDPFSQKPYVEFYATQRVGGDVTSFDAIKLYKLAA